MWYLLRRLIINYYIANLFKQLWQRLASKFELKQYTYKSREKTQCICVEPHKKLHFEGPKFYLL